MRETMKLPRGIRRRKGSIFLWVRWHANGRRYEESSKSTKLADAIRLQRLRQGDVAKGLPVSPKVGRVTLDEALKAVVADYTMNKRDTTADVQRRIDLHLRPYFKGHTRMAGITPTQITAFKVSRQTAGASNGEINRELAILRRAFVLCLDAGTLMAKPKIAMLEEAPPRAGFFERAEFEEVCKHLKPVLQRVLALAYYSGWRVQSEILPLQWRQVDFDAGVVRLDPGQSKNDEPRRFPFGELVELRDLLAEQREVTTRLEREKNLIVPWVFHRKGKPIKRFDSAWGKACAEAGCPGRLVHDLRRTAVRNLTRTGTPEQVAMKLTGHRTRAVFDRYDITSETDLKAAVGRLGAQAGTLSGQSAPRGQARRLGGSKSRKIS